jgi:hypothetical protein
MAASKELIERLETLKANIEAFLKLHKNPYDSSVHNDLAARLERVEAVLAKLYAGSDLSNDTGGETGNEMGGDDTGGETGNEMGGDNTGGETGNEMGGDNTGDETGNEMGGDNTGDETGNEMGNGTGEDTTSDTGVDTSRLARSISGSVGKGGDNKEEDVRTVQGWLNSHGASLEVNGQSDNTLINEIKKFQRRLGQTRPDGRVDPDKNTWKGLMGEIEAGPPSTAVSSIIQGGESGAAGYNAYNRGTVGNTMIGADKPLKLVEMPLAEIRRMQELPGGHEDKLFAVGKYQMIPDTLEDGIKKLDLDTSRLYDAATQEYLFSDYLMKKKRPAIHEYVTGGGSKQSAGLAGAQEWASIACPPGTIGARGYDVSGRSYYDGIGGNGAHISHEDFIAALDEARVEYQKYLGQGMSSDEAYRAAVSGIEKDANSGGSGDETGDDTGGDNTGDDTGTGTSQSITGSVGRGGDNNEADVKLVQELLNAKGAQLDKDGKIGDKTIGAIEDFQSSLGMTPDGLVEPDKNTWKGLTSGSGDGTGTGDDMGGDNTGDGTGQSITGSVGRGGDNNEADVKVIQGLLNAKGGELDVDGKIGNKTIGSIESFQDSLGMTPDGLVEPDKNTWKGLIGSGGSVDPSVVSTGGSGSTASSDFNPGEELQPGSRPGTSNFSLDEFCVSGSRPDLAVEPPQNMWSTVQRLFNNLEKIRAATGSSIRITSGYRSPELNSAIGGASASKHMLCQAADMVSGSLSPNEFRDVIKRLMDAGEITPGGLKAYGTFVHYDIRGSYTTW